MGHESRKHILLVQDGSYLLLSDTVYVYRATLLIESIMLPMAHFRGVKADGLVRRLIWMIFRIIQVLFPYKTHARFQTTGTILLY